MSVLDKKHRKLGLILAVVWMFSLSGSLVLQVSATADDSNANIAENIEEVLRKFSNGLLPPSTELIVDGKVYAVESIDGMLTVREGTLSNPRFRVYMDSKTLNFLLSSKNKYQLWLRLKLSLKKETITVMEVPRDRSYELEQLESVWTEGYIITGEVKDIQCRWENDLIYSYVTITTTDVSRGPEDLKGEDIIIKHIGGGIDDTVLMRSDQPYFMVDEEVMLNIQIDEELHVFTVIAGPKGKVSLSRESQPIEAFTAAGYKLSWYYPGVGWSTSTTRPGAGWYGPLKWHDLPVNWYIDQSTSYSGISWTTFETFVKPCYQVWEDDTGSYLDYTYQGFTTGKTWGSNDGVNIFCWRYIDGGGGTLGICNTWGELVGTDQMKCTDSDIELDTGDTWSAANTCPAGYFDVQNVGTHEAGHVAHLADIYDGVDSDMTMYGYSSTGETKKRTLAWGDIDGLYALFPSCLIATATYGSELSPEVQFLRGFRDQAVLPTFAGSSFMTAFNNFYYSFSPAVASQISLHEGLRAVMRLLLYPLIGILHVAESVFSVLSFNAELGVVMSGLVASFLIAVVYIVPWVLILYAKKRVRIPHRILQVATFLWLGSIACIALAEVVGSSLVMMFSTSLFVLATMSVAVLASTKMISRSLAKVK